jgi:hypothetical protein
VGIDARQRNKRPYAKNKDRAQHEQDAMTQLCQFTQITEASG